VLVYVTFSQTPDLEETHYHPVSGYPLRCSSP
jgi:hypothetical protein